MSTADTVKEQGAVRQFGRVSNAHNTVKGLTREEMVECLVAPLQDPSDFLEAFEELESCAWYLHHSSEGRYYFGRNENLTKLLQTLAEGAPQNKVDDEIRGRLIEMFAPTRKVP